MRSYIKTYTSYLHDIRFSQLSAEAERTYNRLYVLAGTLEENGLFFENGRQLSNEEIAYRIRLDTKEVIKSMKELQRNHLLHVNGKGAQVIDWKNEQVDLNKERELARARQAKHRTVTRDTPLVTENNDASRDVTHIEKETKTQIKTQSLSLLKGHAERLKQHPSWIDEAVDVAAQMNKLTPAYVAGIVKNWLAEGRTPTKGSNRAKSNYGASNPKRPDQPKPAQANYTDSDREAAKRVLAKRAKANVP